MRSPPSSSRGSVLADLEGGDLGFDVGPVLGQGLALPREHRNAGLGDGCGRLVLCRIDVARGPGDLGAQLDQRLDENRRLDGHVQAARDTRALERPVRAELLAQGHETGHFLFRHADLLAAKLGRRDVLAVEGRSGVVIIVQTTSRLKIGLLPALGIFLDEVIVAAG